MWFCRLNALDSNQLNLVYFLMAFCIINLSEFGFGNDDYTYCEELICCGFILPLISN